MLDTILCPAELRRNLILHHVCMKCYDAFCDGAYVSFLYQVYFIIEYITPLGPNKQEA